jgi:hypothetical protein
MGSDDGAVDVAGEEVSAGLEAELGAAAAEAEGVAERVE